MSVVINGKTFPAEQTNVFNNILNEDITRMLEDMFDFNVTPIRQRESGKYEEREQKKFYLRTLVEIKNVVEPGFLKNALLDDVIKLLRDVEIIID